MPAKVVWNYDRMSNSLELCLMCLVMRRELNRSTIEEWVREPWTGELVLKDENTPFPNVRTTAWVVWEFGQRSEFQRIRSNWRIISDKQVAHQVTDAVAKCIEVEFGGQRHSLREWESQRIAGSKKHKFKGGHIWDRLRRGLSISEALGIRVKPRPEAKPARHEVNAPARQPVPEKESPVVLVNKSLLLVQLSAGFLQQASEMMKG
jgi:hypothetical protein